MTGRVLVTGGTGFVGRQVLKHLSGLSIDTCVVARTGSEGKIPAGIPCELILTPSMFHEREKWWVERLREVDTVIHLAWHVVPGQYLTARENLDCLIGTLLMARAAEAAGVRRFVGIGTCLEYDLTVCPVSIDTPLRPLTPYASAKASTYHGLARWLESRSVEFAWCRLFYLYGEAEDSRRLVPYLRRQLEAGRTAELTSGEQVRDCLDVEEAAGMIVETALGPMPCRLGQSRA